ncbi:hypothetical protein ACWGAN_07670 [Streptomyces sp. NPDC054945]
MWLIVGVDSDGDGDGDGVDHREGLVPVPEEEGSSFTRTSLSVPTCEFAPAIGPRG